MVLQCSAQHRILEQEEILSNRLHQIVQRVGERQAAWQTSLTRQLTQSEVNGISEVSVWILSRQLTCRINPDEAV